MYCKLRIPFIIFTFGTVSGIFQKFLLVNSLFESNSFLGSFVYIGTLGAIIYALEKLNINEKKIHYSLAFLLISGGFLLDYLMH